VRSRILLALACLAALPQMAALPSPPWQGQRAGTISTIAGGKPLPASVAPDALACYGATGLAADPTDGSLYLIDAGRSMVLRLAPGGQTVEPWAGAPSAGFNGDGRPALETAFHGPSALAIEPRSGELFVADTLNHRVRAIAADRRQVRTVAGVGIRGLDPERLPTEPLPPADGAAAGAAARFSGDGGAAVEAELSYPSGVAADALGMLYIADSGNHRIRAVNRGVDSALAFGVELLPGQIRTVAGTGKAGAAGDGGRAAAAELSFPTELHLDGQGDLLVLDGGGRRIRKIDHLTGLIRTVAAAPPGDRLAGFGITGAQELVYSNRRERSIHVVDRGGVDHFFLLGRALTALGSVAVGPGGEIYAADEATNRVFRIDEGRARTLLGGATAPSRTDLADAELAPPGALAVDAYGNLALADGFAHSVRRVLLAERVVETFMGTGSPGTAGDGGPPALAELIEPTGILIDGDWTYYITDRAGSLVRRVAMGRDGLRVEAVAGSRDTSGFAEGRPATAVHLAAPFHAARRGGDLSISCQGDHSIRRVDRDGRISIVAGTGRPGFSGDGGPARQAQLAGPAALAYDAAGNLYVADTLNHRIRRIDPSGRITTWAGTGERGYSGDGGPAVQARLNDPDSLVFDPRGNLYFADTNNHCVRRIAGAPPHRIETVAGNGRRGCSGDGGPAREAQLNLPRGIALSRDSFLYIADSLNRRLRAVKLPPEAPEQQR
jgi:sugar lactone lactonase YvrE